MDQGVDMDRDVQIAKLIDTTSSRAVFKEIERIFRVYYPSGSYAPVAKNCKQLAYLFKGRFKGYRACNTEYHDLTHTVDATLAVVRLLDGYNQQNPLMPERIALNLVRAALLHDTGYIQESWDTEGSGAKYTASHVERSVTFLDRNRKAFRIESAEVPMISNIIRCTGLSVNLDAIPFSSDEERIAGCILGTADLLGQMSDRAYLEKLLFLYYEFREAGIDGFNTEFDILRRTVDFYEITVKRMRDAYMNVSEYARFHFRRRFGIDANLYTEAIARHIAYLHRIIEDDTTNFRHKLKRGPWVHDERQDRNH